MNPISSIALPAKVIDLKIFKGKKLIDKADI